MQVVSSKLTMESEYKVLLALDLHFQSSLVITKRQEEKMGYSYSPVFPRGPAVYRTIFLFIPRWDL